MTSTLRKLHDLLTPSERGRALQLFAMILVMAVLDVAGVASIMPFMAVLANPSLVETNTILSTVYAALGMTDPNRFLLYLGLAAFGILVISLSFKALTTYAQLRFTLMREYSIGRRLVEGYLYQSYPWFLQRNSADLGNKILTEVRTVIGSAILPMLTLIAQGAVVAAILLLLLAVNPGLALTVGAVLGVAYGAVFTCVSKYLATIGSDRVKASQQRFLVVNEAFGAIKEVKIGGFEQEFLRRFSGPAEVYARHQASAQVVAQLPRFALEAVAFGGMLLVVLYHMVGKESIAATLPVIALYAFAGYRLMPALQQVYSSVSQLKFAGPALDALHADAADLAAAEHGSGLTAIQLNDSIEISDGSFQYPSASRATVDHINLRIPAKTTIGLVGKTGSGKTTLVDIVLGLLELDEGRLAVDGVRITASNRRAWQRLIGYVPQQIYLSDDTIAANIAFGDASARIDMEAVERAARIANLHEYVASELPNGYATVVGERGVRLSGGQRQRIGIARALYRSPQLLILDEATSALDNVTEQAVMEAVRNLGHNITIIMIAHRLSTVRECDEIVLLEKGKIVCSGTYDYLQTHSDLFRNMTLAQRPA